MLMPSHVAVRQVVVRVTYPTKPPLWKRLLLIPR